MEYNYFYGAILIDRDYEGSKRFIAEEMLAKNYYYFHPNIFSLGEYAYPYYYENILISFGRTAKYFVDETGELEKFITEFEDILQHLDFETAQIKVAASYSDYQLFWLNKEKIRAEDRLEKSKKFLEADKIRFYESEKFYFGLGEVDLFFGSMRSANDPEKMECFDLQYPGFFYPFGN
jgi:hypothetical protein